MQQSVQSYREKRGLRLRLHLALLSFVACLLLVSGGQTWAGNPDFDGDGISDPIDNCPFVSNADQADTDNDGVGDQCDPVISSDNDGDNYTPPLDCDDNDASVNPGAGEVADGKDNDCDGSTDEGFLDADSDGVLDQTDNCPFIANPGQADGDNDGVGDACDLNNTDSDGDGSSPPLDCDDNNASVNPGAPEIADGIDNDCDGATDEGLLDSDSDGVFDQVDNCPLVPNTTQSDADSDGLGDACDPVNNADADRADQFSRAGAVGGAAFAERYSSFDQWSTHGQIIARLIGQSPPPVVVGSLSPNSGVVAQLQTGPEPRGSGSSDDLQIAFATPSSSTLSLSDSSVLGFWASAGYSNLHRSSNFDGDVWHGRAGLDYVFNQRVLAGIAIGYDDGALDFEGAVPASLTSNTLGISGYFGVMLGAHLLFEGSGGYAGVDYEIDDGTASRSFDGDRWHGTTTVSGVVTFGRVRVLPNVGVRYLTERQDAYVDSGGAAIDSQDFELAQMRLGAEAYLPLTRGMELFVRGRGDWDFEKSGSGTAAPSELYFTDDWGASAGGGLQFQMGEAFSLHLEGHTDSLFRDDVDLYGTKAGFSLRF